MRGETSVSGEKLRDFEIICLARGLRSHPSPPAYGPEWSYTKHILFVQTSQFDWLSWQPGKMLNLRKICKNQLIRSYMGIKLKCY